MIMLRRDMRPQPPIVVDAPAKVRARLDQLGLALELLQAVLDDARAHFAECTSHHPRPYPGAVLQAEAIRGLRDHLSSQGWAVRDRANYATVVHPSGSWELAAACGTSATGDRDQTPSTRNTKGSVSKAVVQQNQMSFFDSKPSVVTGEQQTWVLLLYVNPLTLDLRAELSLPLRMDDSQRIAGWAERIIIPTTGGGALVSRHAPGLAPRVPGGAEIEVSRKEP